jgi:ankyrin repeat protein
LWNTQEEYDGVVVEAVEAGFRDLVEWLMGPGLKGRVPSASGDGGKGTRERELLLAGIKKGQVPVVRVLLRMGQKWNEALPKEALALAAVAGHAEMVSFLHDEVGGIDLEAEGPFGTPLRSASLMGYDRVVRLLLSWGADAEASGRLADALQAAAQNGHTHVMRLLMDAGADCNQPGKPHGTCLQAAAYYGHRDAVALLLDQGADMYQGGKSKDALHAAVDGGHEAVALLLLARGYRVPPKGSGLPRPLARLAPWATHSRPARPWEKNRWYYRAQLTNPETALARDSTSAEEDGSGTSSIQESKTSHSWNGEGDRIPFDATFDADDDEDRVAELELSAAMGKVPDVRQRLLRPKHLADNAKAALRAAAVTGQVEVLRGLLQDGPANLDETSLLIKVLLIASRFGQLLSVRFLCERLAEKCTTATSSGGPAAVPGLLEASRPPESPAVLKGLASAIRTAATAKHSAVVHVLWSWVLDGTIRNQGLGVRGAPEEAAVEPSLLELCLGGNGRVEGWDPDGQLPAVLGELLTAGLESENADAVELLLVKMEQEGLEEGSIMPAFASACRDGSGAVGHLLRRRSGSLALSAPNLPLGAYTAAVFGHCEVLCILLNELLERGTSLSGTAAVDTAINRR